MSDMDKRMVFLVLHMYVHVQVHVCTYKWPSYI